MRRALGPSALLVVVLAWPAAALATAPGPPNVDVVPPAVVVDERGELGVVFDPGLILFTYADGSETSCVLDPALPPNPCTELESAPGPPDVDIVPPEAVRLEDGSVGFIAGSILITYDDGSQLACILDPAVPPSPCSEVIR